MLRVEPSLDAETLCDAEYAYLVEAFAAAILAYRGHVLMELRSGLVVGAVVTHADDYGEHAAALAMLDSLAGRRAPHPQRL